MYRRWGCELRPSGFNPACLWPCLSTSPVEMAGTKAQAAAVILGHHAPVSYGGNACLGATRHLREHRTAPAYECTALACVLQPPKGGQAATPSMQLPRPLPKNGFEGPTWILPLSANPGKDRAQTAFFEVSQAGTASECHKHSILIF